MTYEFEIDKHHHLSIENSLGRIHFWTTEEDLKKLGKELFLIYGEIDWT